MNESGFTINLTKIIEEFSLERVHSSSNIDEIIVSTSDINRPALQIAGFYDYYDSNRLQVLGRVEITYLEQFTRERRCELLDKLFCAPIVFQHRHPIEQENWFHHYLS